MRKFAVIMQLPEGKLPGFYAQVIKALATKAQVFDREKEILIIEHIQNLSPIQQILDQYNISFDFLPLIHVPSSATLKPDYEDFGFITRSDHTFLYEDSIILFTFTHILGHSEDYAMALIQLDEHLIASFPIGETLYYIAEKQYQDCFLGIAKAYQCTFKLVANMEEPLETTL